jgi:hypothetical protein
VASESRVVSRYSKQARLPIRNRTSEVFEKLIHEVKPLCEQAPGKSKYELTD